MKIALFDHTVSARSPAGSCDARVLEALCDEHKFTVFASTVCLHGARQPSITHTPIVAVRRPALVSFLAYFAGACLAYAYLKLRGRRFDLIQATDCALPTADVCYAHFCHRAFLAKVWPQVRHGLTLRTLHSWANHAVRALIESRLLRRARVIVVPSEGLKRDLERLYPGTADKVCVIQNTVDLERFDAPPEFDRRDVRKRLSTGQAHTAFVFVALGHFERKGLPLLLEALREAELDSARLWVVGGERGLVASYGATARRLGIADRVSFVGTTEDVRPFLWSADAFVAPSHYEAFSLGLLEAAAAGLPLIATRISGSEELLVDGVNGLQVEPTPTGVGAGLRRFCQLDGADREAMGRAARQSTEPLRPERFRDAWRALYASLEG